MALQCQYVQDERAPGVHTHVPSGLRHTRGSLNQSCWNEKIPSTLMAFVIWFHVIACRYLSVIFHREGNTPHACFSLRTILSFYCLSLLFGMDPIHQLAISSVWLYQIISEHPTPPTFLIQQEHPWRILIQDQVFVPLYMHFINQLLLLNVLLTSINSGQVHASWHLFVLACLCVFQCMHTSVYVFICVFLGSIAWE